MSKSLSFFNKIFPFNKVIKILIITDTVLFTALGFILPILAIFITEYTQGGDIRVIGFATFIYWITLSLVLIPSGKYLDKNQNEKDDFYFIIIGILLVATAVFGYIFTFLPWHIYLLQMVYAFGMGIYIPGYMAIFTRHIDKGKEASSWSTRMALMGIGAGIAGVLGGTIAHYFGFRILFLGVIVLFLIAAVLPLLIYRELVLKKK